MKYFLIILGASFCFSCGEDEVDPLASAAGFCEGWAEAVCSDDVLNECGDGTDTQEEDCLSSAGDLCGETVTSRSYGGEGASACLSAVSTAFEDAEISLDEYNVAFLLMGDDCGSVLSGDGEEGDSCDSTSECDRSLDLECVFKEGEGTCVVPVLQGGGDRCSEPEQICSNEHYCDGSNCLSRPIEDEDCNEDVPCALEFRCEDEVCVPKAALRDDCTSNDDCSSGLCDVGPDGEDGICVTDIVLGPRSPVCENFSE